MVPPAVSETIDWISYTAHHNTPALTRQFKNSNPSTIAAQVTPFGTRWIECKARFGYTVGLECAECPSAKVYMSPARPDMGVHVVLPGSAIRYGGLMLCHEFALHEGNSISRFDIAADVYEIWTGLSFEERFTRGEVETEAKKYMHITGGSGWTFYVGSRTSEKYLRIYDKRAESKLDYDLTRVELECKGDFARGVAKYLMANGLSHIRSIIQSYCNFHTHERWVSAMLSPTPFVGLPRPERASNTRAWLLQTVAPALVKYAEQNEGFWADWYERVLTLRPSSGVGEVDIFDGKGDFDLP